MSERKPGNFQRWLRKHVAPEETIEAAVRGVPSAVVLAERHLNEWATRAQVDQDDKQALDKAVQAQFALAKARSQA